MEQQKLLTKSSVFPVGAAVSRITILQGSFMSCTFYSFWRDLLKGERNNQLHCNLSGIKAHLLNTLCYPWALSSSCARCTLKTEPQPQGFCRVPKFTSKGTEALPWPQAKWREQVWMQGFSGFILPHLGSDSKNHIFVLTNPTSSTETFPSNGVSPLLCAFSTFWFVYSPGLCASNKKQPK